MTSSGLASLGIAEASRLIRDKALSPVTLTEALLERIAALDGQFNAFLHVGTADALAQAEVARAEIEAGNWRGPLHGIAFALKDIIDVAGQITTCHSRLMPLAPAQRDATVTSRLRAAGAVLIGKLALHEFAIGGPAFDLPWPPARNPWNVAVHPGGSSSGCGAAVAAGFVPAAIGTDTGGSVRNPATCCGIIGMKPTYGRISRAGVFPLSFSLDHVGPMTRSVEDNAILFAAVAGSDAADATCLNLPAPDCLAGLHDGVQDLRIGVIEHFHCEDAVAHPEMVAALAEASETLRSLGAIVGPVRLPSLADFVACGRTIQQAEQYAVHERWLQNRPEDYCGLSRAKLVPGAFLTATRYVQALQQRRLLGTKFEEAMVGYDACIALSGFMLPAPIDDAEQIAATYDKHARMPFNVLGVPAMSVPTGLSRSGLPLGMQIIGSALSEPMLYRIAQAYCLAAGTTGDGPWRKSCSSFVTLSKRVNA